MTPGYRFTVFQKQKPPLNKKKMCIIYVESVREWAKKRRNSPSATHTRDATPLHELLFTSMVHHRHIWSHTVIMSGYTAHISLVYGPGLWLSSMFESVDITCPTGETGSAHTDSENTPESPLISLNLWLNYQNSIKTCAGMHVLLLYL